MEQHIYSVSDLNNLVKDLLDSEPALSRVYVRGEISNYKLYPSGHHYFSLKDAEGAVRCVLFRGRAAGLRFQPADGMKVIALGQVTLFVRDGAYQLQCASLIPEGVGDLHMAFEQLKEKLYREGLFDEDHKKPLPPFPRTIAVITSSAGDVIHDICTTLRPRWPMAKIMLLPVRVQGPEAPPEIVGALRYVNRHKLADIIITGRGGGSMEDLWAFNDERVARAIYDSELPVISAVGHEPDVTISDFVADARASTPSNAAEIAVPDQEALKQWLSGAASRLERSETARLAALRQRLETLAEKRVLRDQMAYVQDKRMELLHVQQRLGDLSAGLVAGKRERVSVLGAALDAMSPLKVLGRGYAMAQGPSGEILRSWREVRAGERVSVALGEGGFLCTVEEPYEKEGTAWPQKS